MTSTLTVGDVSIDCKEPEKLRDFYADLSGWQSHTMFGFPALVADNGLTILFMGCDVDYCPPAWPAEPGQQQKQMHFDFQSDDLPSAVAQAIRLGATKATSQYGGEHFVTMIDPEGHPFCLCQR